MINTRRTQANEMKFYFPYRLGLLLIAVLILGGCAAHNAQRVGPTPIKRAQQEIPEDQLLDVGIQIFESEEITEEQSEEGTSPEIRKAEGHFIPYHLKNTLQQSSYWGAVRVLPSEAEGIDVLVKGKILESNGEHLVLQVDVSDTSGKAWFSKKYESKATLAYYSGNRVGEKDAYQDIYNAISNDLANFRMKLPPEKVKNIRSVSKLKFAEDLAKEYDFKTKEEYFNYIVESLENGNRKQVRELFNQMVGFDQKDFLVDYLKPAIGLHKSTMNICIIELTIKK